MLAMGGVFWRRGFSECDLPWRKMKSQSSANDDIKGSR